MAGSSPHREIAKTFPGDRKEHIRARQEDDSRDRVERLGASRCGETGCLTRNDRSQITSKTTPEPSFTSAPSYDQAIDTSSFFKIDNARIQRMPFAETFLRDLLGLNGLKCVDPTPVQSLYSRLITPSREPIGATYEALVLFALGTATSDPSIVLEARKRHLWAIQRIRKDLERLSSHIKPVEAFSIIARAYALLACEVYDDVSSGIAAWDIQLPGILALLSPQVPLPNTVFRALRHITILRSFVLRRPAVWHEDIWQSDTSTVARGSVEKLMRLALRLPVLLEKVRASLKTPLVKQDESVVCRSQLNALQVELVQWLSEYHDISSKEKQQQQQEGGASSTGSSEIAVPSHYIRYVSILSASVHAFYMICMLLLREALYDLAENKKSPELFGEVERYADLLYCSVPYLNEAAAGGQLSRANSVGAPLYFASQWFQRSGSTEKVQKCRVMETRLFDEDLSYFDRQTTLPWSLVVLCYVD